MEQHLPVLVRPVRAVVVGARAPRRAPRRRARPRHPQLPEHLAGELSGRELNSPTARSVWVFAGNYLFMSLIWRGLRCAVVFF